MKRILLSIAVISSLMFGACSGGGNKQADKETDKKKEKAAKEEKMADKEKKETPEKTILPVPDGAKVFFKNLEDGDEVTSPVKVQMGVEGMEVQPAGEQAEGKGHHHVIIDGAYIKEGEIVPTKETSIHFGKGQTETELELEPGEHKLTLQFADGFHQSYGEQMSASVTIKVKE